MEMQLLEIVKAMAKGALSREWYGGYERYFCVHCGETWTDGEDEDDHGYITHTPECPVIQAREVMSKSGLDWRE